MKLEKVSIANLKGLKQSELEPGAFACLVGENNAGKSTALQAIVYALNRPATLPLSMYYDKTWPVVIELTFSGIAARDLLRLKEEHRSRIQPLISDGRLEIQIVYKPDERCEVTISKRLPREEKYLPDVITDLLKGKQGKAIRNTLAESFPEFAEGLPDALNITQAKAFLDGKITQLPEDQFESKPVPLPSGISSSISALLPEPIYIPAVKNLADDLKTTQSTSFGRLLGLLLDDLTPELDEINQSLRELNGLLNRVVNGTDIVDGRHTKVQTLERVIEGFLKENFPAVRVELDIPPPELKTILNSAQIYVDDGSKDLVDNKGDGIKRSLTFALLQAYVSHIGGSDPGEEDKPLPRPLIFLFEEPELYLHPKSQRVLFRTLARISSGHQVIVTTHSPLFFEPGVTASFVRVAKQDADPKPVGKLYPVRFELDPEKSESFKMARFENADAAFFSRRVVLFEGESDDAFCRHVAKSLRPEWDFDTKNVALVRVSGKGNFGRFRRFFEAFGIDVRIVADLDALFDGFQHLGANPDATGLREAAFRTIDDRIAALGIKAEPAPRQIRDRVHKQSWKDRYDAAKTALRKMQQTKEIDEAALMELEELFVWEEGIARCRVCREDEIARDALVPLLDNLRASGICVLSKGAIEDYYPPQTPTSGAKPERALEACRLILNQASAEALSGPIAQDRPPELVQIFDALLSD
ncbi:AAA family ATPase [Asticcacaulis sp. DXS10W]|uniref:AAA family ATPase n=1 Tax=Asticcacaulis currens TaxID=2984210 RepID=A0ABT5IDJ7_9CAUL|nr:AAA family ATPase [Asticcacaulis currens]MDC7694238.1 AAA family ATPase [Asticcacaulis currens]